MLNPFPFDPAEPADRLETLKHCLGLLVKASSAFTAEDARWVIGTTPTSAAVFSAEVLAGAAYLQWAIASIIEEESEEADDEPVCGAPELAGDWESLRTGALDRLMGAHACLLELKALYGTELRPVGSIMDDMRGIEEIVRHLADATKYQPKIDGSNLRPAGATVMAGVQSFAEAVRRAGSVTNPEQATHDADEILVLVGDWESLRESALDELSTAIVSVRQLLALYKLDFSIAPRLSRVTNHLDTLFDELAEITRRSPGPTDPEQSA